jgi:hypothetical protein
LSNTTEELLAAKAVPPTPLIVVSLQGRARILATGAGNVTVRLGPVSVAVIETLIDTKHSLPILKNRPEADAAPPVNPPQVGVKGVHVGNEEAVRASVMPYPATVVGLLVTAENGGAG